MNQNEPQTKGAFDEARDLFEQMSNEARRQAEVEKEAARNRSPLVKILLALTITACLAAAITFFYGFYAFWDAPIRPAGAGFVNKQGQPRTKEDYENFKLWEKALLFSVGSAFALAIAFGIADSREKRRRKFSKVLGVTQLKN